MTASYPRLVDSGIQSPQSIYELSTTQEHEIGQCGRLIGGRVFYYARYSAAATTARGLCFAAATPTTLFQNVAVGTIAQQAKTLTGVSAGTTAAAAVTKNAFQYLAVNDGTAEGLMFRVESHGTITNTTTTQTGLTVKLYDELPIALPAASEVSMVKDIYADVVVAPTDGADRLAGVANVTMVDSSTTARYFWCQSYGPCAAFVTGTSMAEGSPLVIGTTAGHLIVATATVAAVSIVGTHTSNATKISTTVTPTATTTANRVMAYSLNEATIDAEVNMVDLIIRAA
jgi:hypothetical protein